MENKKSKLFIVTSILIIILVILDFVFSEPFFELSFYIIVALAMLIIIVLSDNFDKLSIPKILTLEKQLKNEHEEKIEYKQENMKLLKHITNITNSNTQNTNILFKVNKNTEQNDEVEISDITNDVVEAKDNNIDSNADDELKNGDDFINRRQVALKRRMYIRKVHDFLVKHQSMLFDSYELSYNVEIELKSNNLDQIMKKSVIFDGLAENGLFSFFFDVYCYGFRASLVDSLFFKLTLLKDYREVNNNFSKLFLIIPRYDDELDKIMMGNSRNQMIIKMIEDKFCNAIQNNLLEIKLVDVSKEEIDNFEIEIEK